MEAIQGCEKQLRINNKRREVKIPAGIADSQRIRFHDFVLLVDVQPDKVFKREGNDIFISQKIDYPTAVLGGTIEVPTIEGEVKLKIRPATQSGTLIRLRGKGVSSPGLFSQKGDQYVQVMVDVPRKISRKQRQILNNLKKTW